MSTKYLPVNSDGRIGPKCENMTAACCWIIKEPLGSEGWDVQLVSAEPTLQEIQDQLPGNPAAARRND